MKDGARNLLRRLGLAAYSRAAAVEGAGTATAERSTCPSARSLRRIPFVDLLAADDERGPEAHRALAAGQRHHGLLGHRLDGGVAQLGRGQVERRIEPEAAGVGHLAGEDSLEPVEAGEQVPPHDLGVLRPARPPR